MTSWILAIDRSYPQHSRIAAEHGLWDMTKHAQIRAGDHVYFWLNGHSLVSQTVATSDPWRLTPADRLPWDDAGVREYHWRFTLRVLSQAPVAQPRWAVLQTATGVRAGLNFGPQEVTSAEGEAWLAAQFDATPVVPALAAVDIRLDDSLRVELEAVLGEDLRERALREIALRQGQPAFRAALIAAYGGTCCITGYQTESVLEAAHISPYMGPHTNDVTNGLLLRSDIHTLFDRHLLTVTPEHVIRVSPALGGSPYEHFDRRALPMPSNASDRPSPLALHAHNADCRWLVASANKLF